MDEPFNALDVKDNGSPKKMGTTMTLLRLHEEGAFMAHMGDSRIYHIRPGTDGKDTGIIYESSDHSLVNDLIRLGEMTREEARNSRQKNIITRAMQPHMNKRPTADVHETSDIRKGDFFLLCSDGMLEQPEMEDGSLIRKIFSLKGGTDEEKVRILRTLTEGNKDNHSALIIHITDVESCTSEADSQSMKVDNRIMETDSPIMEVDRQKHNSKLTLCLTLMGLIAIIIGIFLYFL